MKENDNRTNVPTNDPEFHRIVNKMREENERAMELIRQIYQRVSLLKPIGNPSCKGEEKVPVEKSIISDIVACVDEQREHNDTLAEISNHLAQIVGT